MKISYLNEAVATQPTSEGLKGWVRKLEERNFLRFKFGLQQSLKSKYAKNSFGFTLIEVVIFIIVMGIIGVRIFVSMKAVLGGTLKSQQQTIATQTAIRCIEWYLHQRDLKGFNATTLPCPSSVVPSSCTYPAGYTISSNVACTQLYGDVGSNYKTVTVNVNAVGSSNTASLSLLLASY